MQNTITEAYSQMYSTKQLLVEELHPEIQNILDSDSIQQENKLDVVSKKVRELASAGVDTGLENSTPKMGSSRAVFFPKEAKQVVVDGNPTTSQTAVKIAFKGILDHHHKNTMFGIQQNQLEADPHLTNNYSVLAKKDDGTFKTNDSQSGGIIPPVFSSHPEGHHIEMGKAAPIGKGDMIQLTRTPDFPHGITFDDIFHTLNREHSYSMGQPYNGSTDERMDKVSKHPWVSDAINFMHDSGLHPCDFAKRNCGVYTHPVSGKRHLVMLDYGYSSNLAKQYTDARKKRERSGL